MRIYTADGADYRRDELLDSQRAPVRVMRDGRIVGVQVGGEAFEAARTLYVERLLRTIDEVADGLPLPA